MGKRSSQVAALVLVMAAVISEANSGGGPGIDCFASTDCTGTPIVDASVADARTCCIGDGFSYDLMDGSGCQICNVHGFAVSSLTVSESGTPTNLVVMNGVKGTRLPIFFINSLEAIDITARRENGDFFFADIPVTQIPVVVQAVVSFTAMGDSVAQEGNETFQIRIPTISPPLPPGNFFRDTVTITITDDNFLSLQFTEVDYAIQEPGLTLPVQIRAVRIDGTSVDVGNPVTIRVTPLTYSQFEDRDIQLPPGFPTGPPTRPDDPAEVTDFDTSSFEVVLQPGEMTVDAPIDVVDDAIDENREGFVAILEVVDAVDVSMIDLTQRQVTQCNIDDDDTSASGIDCFVSTVCTGTPIVDASVADARTCCIGDGFSYDLMDGSGCQICNVHGFTVSSLTVSESGTLTDLDVMNGVKGSSVGVFFIDGLEAIDITARRQDGDFTFTDASVTRIPVFAQRPSVVRFSALGDRVAQEGNETFQIRITSITPPLPPGNFLRDTVTITIADNNFLSVQFTEVDYAIQEPGLTLPVQIRAVRPDGTSVDVGNPVTIRVTPLTYSQFEDRDIQLPPGFPTGPPTRPDDPAEVIDFDTSSFEVVLQPGQTTVDAPIDVVDDAIDENREGFVAILEVVDAIDVSMIDLTQRQVTQCNIGDDDSLGIGFELDFHEFPEGITAQDLTVRLQKENSGHTELDYLVTVTLLPTVPEGVTGFQLATEDVDFEFSEQTITFLVVDQFQDVAFRIIGDTIPEGAEAFALRVDRNPDGPPLLSAIIPETTVAILNDDAQCPNPVSIVNGGVIFTGNSVGDTAAYTCDSGFELIGATTTTCTQVDANTAEFSPTPPVCRRVPELDLSFTGNSPRLGVGTINAELFSNRPGIQISCFLHRTTFIQDCSNGTATFTNVPAGGYSLRVIATDRETGDTVEIRAGVFVPESDEFCSVNAINRLVSVSGNSATIEFISTGNPIGFLCRVDRQTFIPCTSPFTTTGLDSGGHRLRVRPMGCGRPRDGHKSLSVSFNV